LKVHPQKSLDRFPDVDRLPETPGLEPIILEMPPFCEGHSARHFHSTVCFGMAGEVCTDCVIRRELVSSYASERDRLRVQALEKRKRPAEWRSAEEVLDRCMWMDTAWEWHLCQWAINRYSIYKSLVQLKYFGWSCDFDAEQLDEISDQSHEEAWRDLDALCGGLFSGPIAAKARPDSFETCASTADSSLPERREPSPKSRRLKLGDCVLPGKRFLYVGEHFPAECFQEWGFRGVRLQVAAGRGDERSAAWNLSDEVPWPRTSTGALALWPDGETDEVAFDLIILDQPPKKSALVQGFLALFLKHLRSGGALLVKLSSLPKVQALTPLWHLVRIFGCGSVRLRKPGVGPDVHRSSFYVICRNYAGAHVPSLRDLAEVSHIGLQSTSSEVEGAGTDLPPMPTSMPTSPVVLVRNLCALLEALSRDAKPIWTKQYLALRSNLLVLSAQARPEGPWRSPAKEGGPRHRAAARPAGDSTAINKSQLSRGRRIWSTSLSSLSVRPGTEHVQIILILVLWIAANYFIYP
jgi:hypothetical protein